MAIATAMLTWSSIAVADPVDRWSAPIAEASRRFGVPEQWIRRVIRIESGGRAIVRGAPIVSSAGAMGLMQLMPETAAEYGVSNAYDPEQNIRAGTAYLASLIDRYNDEGLALAAYNAGPGAVDKYGRRIPPYRETRNYVARIRNAAPSTSRVSPGVYRTVEIVGGQPVVHYSNKQTAGAAPMRPAKIQ